MHCYDHARPLTHFSDVDDLVIILHQALSITSAATAINSREKEADATTLLPGARPTGTHWGSATIFTLCSLSYVLFHTVII